MPMKRLMALFGVENDTKPENPFAAALGEQLQRIPSDRLEYLAGFAGQLTRVAYADDDISEAEIDVISRLLIDHAELEADETRVVIELLRHQLDELRGCEEYRLNRAINEHSNLDERATIVEFLFSVAAADDLVSNVEDQEIRRIGDALKIPKERFMDIRGRYREQLEVMQAAKAARAQRETS